MFKYAVALTGGIATGKSTVCSLFGLYGFLIIDADKISHDILDRNCDFVSQTFGKEYVSNQKVLRSKLAPIIFENQENKRVLEEFLHPLIKQEIISRAKIFEQNQKPYLIDIPLFFEKRNYDIDNSIVVYTDKQTQIQRLIKRDNISYDEAIIKIENQLDIEQKKDLAKFVIDNSYDLKYLQNEVDRVKNSILKVFNVS
jgi:dephospho-CoA kinase